MTHEVEVSVVMPCLNEAQTLEPCITKALAAFRDHGLAGEVVIADNGSTDGSQAIAATLGARVVAVPDKGYGAALQAGIRAAHGKYVVMGDSDDSYDFSSIYPFIEKLREGYDLVMGNRFKGGIEPGAMPWKHRYIGNPVLSGLGRLFFGAQVGDFHCGLRGFSRDAFQRMDLHTTGMEFASEMVVSATLRGMRMTEVATVLHRDGRTRAPHLRSWHDGWRHLRFLLLFSPRWLFLVPGMALFILGGLFSAVLVVRPVSINGAVLDITTLLVTSTLCLLGYQLVISAVFTKVFAVREGFHPPSARSNAIFRYFTLELGLLVGFAAVGLGLLALVLAAASWGRTGFGQLDPRVTMRQAVPGTMLLSLGVQTIFASFFLSILGIRGVNATPPEVPGGD